MTIVIIVLGVCGIIAAAEFLFLWRREKRPVPPAPDPVDAGPDIGAFEHRGE